MALNLRELRPNLEIVYELRPNLEIVYEVRPGFSRDTYELRPTHLRER
ncbi:unnamed protein product, partial [Timema podura]|nr:unnamed protein product [Timema podura]